MNKVTRVTGPMGTMKMKKLIAILVALLILGLSAVALAGPCQDACFQEKSKAYQRCRSIPPGDRAERTACFKKADADLKSCQTKCK